MTAMKRFAPPLLFGALLAGFACGGGGAVDYSGLYYVAIGPDPIFTMTLPFFPVRSRAPCIRPR